jgi:hypothetical protein
MPAARNKVQRWSGIQGAVASVLVGAFLWSACSGNQATRSEIQATWIPDGASGLLLRTNVGRCQIVLLPDGTFNASVPDYLLKTSDQASGRLMAGTGGWTLLQSAGERQIKLTFTNVEGERISWGASPLEIRRVRGTLQLSFWIGEEGEKRFVFVRQQREAIQPQQ